MRVARECIGTPFLHQGRRQGLGVDCVGLLLVVADRLGLTGVDFPNYYRTPDGTLEEKLSASLWRCVRECIHCHMPGDVLCFKIRNQPQHVAIRTNRGIIHALGDSRKVNETSYDQRWRKRLVSVWEWPELDDIDFLPKAAPSETVIKSKTIEDRTVNKSGKGCCG